MPRALRLALVVMSLLAVGVGCRRTPDPPRNLLLVSIDTLRADAVGAYGQPRPSTPTLDRLAAEGLLFERAATTSPWTLPAHASLLTGLYPHRHGATSVRAGLAADTPLLAELLREHGFRTAAWVTSSYLEERYGFGRGFELFEYVEEKLGRREPSAVVEEAGRWLGGVGEQPFFLFVHLYGVHSDYASLESHEQLFVGPYEGPADGTTAQLLAVRRGQAEMSPADREHLFDLYLAGVRQADEEVAGLLAALERHGLQGSTLVAVVSDHGEELFEHGDVLHGRTQYEEVQRVPWILRGPGIPAGTRVRQPVSLVDFLPTVLGALGFVVPREIDGEDLSPFWGERLGLRPDRRVIFAEGDHHNPVPNAVRSVRLGRYKLICDRATGVEQLFDLESDPGERENVAEQHPEVVEALRRELERFESEAASGVELPELDPEEVEKLRALGYLQ